MSSMPISGGTKVNDDESSALHQDPNQQNQPSIHNLRENQKSEKQSFVGAIDCFSNCIKINDG